MNRIKYFSIALIIFSITLGNIALGQEKSPMPRLLVMDLKPNGVSKEIASSLTDLLDMEIERGRLYQVFSQEDVRLILQNESLKQLLGQDDNTDESLAQIGRAINAPFLLKGSIGKIGNVYAISLDLLDVKEVKALKRINQTLVGDEGGLVGSLRSAALALNLEEKGLTKDISAQLIDKLKIAQKPKKLFLTLSTGYEIPLGPVHDQHDILYFRPPFAHAKVDIDYPYWRMIRFFLSTSFAFTISEQMRLQDKHTARVYNADTNKEIATKFMITTTTLNYSAYKLPLDFGVKIVPETGRFLPFIKIGAGLSYNKYTFADERLGLLQETVNDICKSPYSKNQNYCSLEVWAKPNDDISFLGVDLTTSAGVEWLLSHHIGLKIEATYNFTFALKSEDQLTTQFTSEPIKYESINKDGQAINQKDVYVDLFPVRKLHHGLGFYTGVVAYW